jgi:hypothetical protein
MLLKRGQTMNRPSRLLRPALLVAVLTLLMGAVVQAAGSAAIRDDAGLFTSAGRSAIERAAEQNNVRVVVITNKQRFPSPGAWHAWLRGQATDPNAITIGLHAAPKNVYVVPGAKTGISQDQANQGFLDARSTFNSSGPAEGVIQLIQDYHSMGATAPGGSAAPAGGGFSWGWLVPVIIIALLAFVVLRLLGGRRRAMPGYGPGGPGYGPGPYNQYGGPYQGYGPGYGGGGGFGRGFMGGILGGLGGAWLGNQLFGDRGGDVNAAGPDASQAGPLDTSAAQSMPGEWTGDGGDASQAGGGDWGGNGGDSGWGGDGGGDGGGWGGDGGGDGGWT